MTYAAADARQQILDVLAQAAQELGLALASLSEAYEQLDERTAERVEEQLFRPVQLAYGRARSTHAAFASRSELAGRDFAQAGPPAPSHGVKGLIEEAVADVHGADATLATLQDSLLPIEVGDAELRAGLEQVRELIAGVAPRARELVRTFGR